MLDILPEVAEALRIGAPIVALESTIISHGMPFPQNLEMARAVEETIRAAGAVPATIAILGGRLKAGLTDAECEHLARSGRAVTKVSRRDIPFIIAMEGDGATTVAATMIIANMAGIRIFATGGIGGVHRGATETMDISADLPELANTDVAVVSAGAKSILDLPLTLEYLETHGIPVIGFGTDEFPAFYTPHSGLRVDYRLDTPYDVAKALWAKWHLGLKGGVIIANPVPTEHAMSRAAAEYAVQKSLDEAKEQGIKGKDLTPFLLSRITQITGGDSLQSNMELVFHNARLGAKIAIEYAKIVALNK